ncbi:LuxR family transcriptional regulator [Mycobacterium sp.]|uniref:helix-turn-helix transcriptional regulator n=1 Tax=Mycobacterium sp. TaxID=1785 RepID=UPI0025E6A0E2|nr:LuxR family transcriptional regulator [Mycobacterium sp.]
MGDGHRRSASVVSRSAEFGSVATFLASAAQEPAALLLEGEPGIGKTTVWLAGLEQARELGFRILSTRTAAVESGLAYASLADLLRRVDTAILDRLPPPQKLAVDRILLRTGDDDTATDQHAASAAFLAIVEMLRETSPVLVAIDDLQWLDPSSRHVVAFAARRLAAGVGMLITRRTDNHGDVVPLFEFARPDLAQRITLKPLSLGALHAVVTARLGRSFPRPTMVKILEVSRGNPFYAVEFARVIEARLPVGEITLPRTLSEIVQSRLDGLDGDLQNALLALACMTSATTEQLARAADAAPGHLVDLLEQAEAKGIVEIEGSRIEFAHPLLARGSYDAATPAQRRVMHRRLAGVVDQPEVRARHLALGATRQDNQTLQALDAAAESARIRGAPAAAAELLELALQRGGDTPERRIRTATHHFAAGDTGRARSLLENTVSELQRGDTRAEALHTLAIVRLEDDSFAEAATLLNEGLDGQIQNDELRAQLLITLSYALLNSGDSAGALRTIDAAATEADKIGSPHLASMAQSMRVVQRFMRGDGFDETSIAEAILTEDRDANVPLAFRPHVQNAMLLGLVGKLDRAHEEMLSIRRECVETGGESELMFVGFHTVLQAIWRGDMSEALLVTEDSMERAKQLGGDFPAFIALTLRATVAAYAGREDDARRDIGEALAAGQRSSAFALLGWTVSVLGFLEVSLGNYAAAAAALEPLLAMLNAQPRATEIIPASCLPDAIEALTQLGRFDEAERLVDNTEHNGRRLNRPWILAVGSRARSTLLAARGGLEAAVTAAQDAMSEHERLQMPFERARTQLLLGQLLRRQRRREAATAVQREALATFEQLDMPLWTARAKASLSRDGNKTPRTSVLTASEQRVAELAASGMTNRDVAATLFISVKTVEVNLTRIYRKLDIHSRAELGRRIDQFIK